MMDLRKCRNAAITAGLGLAMAMATAAPALAVTGDSPTAPAGETGSITVVKDANNGSVTYDVYQIFKADVDSAGKATHIQWNSDAMRTAVEGAILAADPSYVGTTAQDALEKIYALTGNGSYTYATMLTNSEFGNQLADAIDAVSGAKVATLTPGTAKTDLVEGFYLIVTTPGTAASGAGTSPIFTPVNHDSAISINEKATVPTVTKTVTDNASGSIPGIVADSDIAQDLDFQVTGTIAKNFVTYGTYKYVIEDQMTHLELGGTGSTPADKVTLKIDGATVKPADYTVSYANDKLTITFADLKACHNSQTDAVIPLSATSVVTLDYKAHLKADASLESGQNKNVAQIKYSSNPNTSDEGATQPVETYVHTYKVELTKIDKSTLAALDGAVFTIKNNESNKYVAADGTLSDTAVNLTTANGGKIVVTGIDAGTYTIHEVTPPTGYAQIDADITLAITPTYDASGARTGLTATFSGGEGDGVDSDSDGIAESGTGIYAVTAATGTIEAKVTNDKEVLMPITGMSGNTAKLVYGSIIVAVSLGAFVITRRRGEEDEA